MTENSYASFSRVARYHLTIVELIDGKPHNPGLADAPDPESCVSIVHELAEYENSMAVAAGYHAIHDRWRRFSDDNFNGSRCVFVVQRSGPCTAAMAFAALQADHCCVVMQLSDSPYEWLAIVFYREELRTPEEYAGAGQKVRATLMARCANHQPVFEQKFFSPAAFVVIPQDSEEIDDWFFGTANLSLEELEKFGLTR